MRKKELEELILSLKEEKLKLEKKLPDGFRRTNSIYQYGRICAFLEVTEEQLNELENKNK
jgi:hypothetical protein